MSAGRTIEASGDQGERPGRGTAEYRYKSRGEEQIALALDRYDIRYLYEAPMAVEDRGKVRLWYPDFFLPEYGIIVEYEGFEGSRHYDERSAYKKRTYEERGLPAIILGPESMRGFWPGRLLEDIEGVLEERVQGFRERTLQWKR